jgi:alkylhydroperoxidase family enzyme
MRVTKALLLMCVALLVLVPIRMAGQAVPDRPGGARPATLKAPRIGPLHEAQWTYLHKQLVAKYLPDGHVGNSFKTLLNVPELVDGTMPFHNYITRDSGLSPRHREILILRTAWLHGSDVVWRERMSVARKAGLTTQELRRVAQGPDAAGWDPFEAALLRFADQLFRNSYVNDALFKVLAASYDGCRLMDAGMTVADFTSLSLLYNALGVQPDEAVPADRMPMDIPYRVVVPERERQYLPAPRLDPLPGPGANNPRTFNLCPKLAKPRSTGSNYVNQVSKLSTTGRDRDRELLILRIGWNSQSEYEWSEHVGPVGKAREKGLPIERITMGPEAPGWDPFEATLLRVVDEMYRDSIVSDRTWNALAERYDDRMRIDAVVTVANYRMVSQALNVLGVQVNPGGERLPKRPSR